MSKQQGKGWRGPFTNDRSGKAEAEQTAEKMRKAWKKEGGKFSVVERNGSVWVIRTDGKYGKATQ